MCSELSNYLFEVFMLQQCLCVIYKNFEFSGFMHQCLLKLFSLNGKHCC